MKDNSALESVFYSVSFTLNNKLPVSLRFSRIRMAFITYLIRGNFKINYLFQKHFRCLKDALQGLYKEIVCFFKGERKRKKKKKKKAKHWWDTLSVRTVFKNPFKSGNS